MTITMYKVNSLHVVFMSFQPQFQILQYATLNGMGGFQGGAMTMGGIGNNSGIQFQQNIAMINSLKKSLNLAVQQNSKLKSRLKKIYLDADISDIPEVSDKYLS